MLLFVRRLFLQLRDSAQQAKQCFATHVLWVHAEAFLGMTLGHVVLSQHVVSASTHEVGIQVATLALQNLATVSNGLKVPTRTHVGFGTKQQQGDGVASSSVLASTQ